MRGRVMLHSMALRDFRSVMLVVDRIAPTRSIIWAVSRRSACPSASRSKPLKASPSPPSIFSNASAAGEKRPVRYFQCRCRANVSATPPRRRMKTTPFRPRSPYAMAKAAALLDQRPFTARPMACTSVLRHSAPTMKAPLRPARFVTRKIVSTARCASPTARRRND